MAFSEGCCIGLSIACGQLLHPAWRIATSTPGKHDTTIHGFFSLKNL
jgi:hypothetical protein